MKYTKLFVIIVFMGLIGPISAQDLTDHRWNDRLLLVYTIDDDSELYIQQIDELTMDREGLDDRKLILYSITPNYVKKGWENGEWKIRNNSLDNILEAIGNFEVALIGLDGTVKLRQDHLLTREKLYATIDAMPMRRRELRNRD